MKQATQFVAVLILTGLGLLECMCADSMDLPRLAKTSRPTVVLLEISDSTGRIIATGTGFFISADGKLITNYHVIEKAHSVMAKTENGTKLAVKGVLATTAQRPRLASG